MKNIVSMPGNRATAQGFKTVNRRDVAEAFDSIAMQQLLNLHEATVIAEDEPQLLQQFFNWAQQLELVDGAIFNCDASGFSWSAGQKRHHSCNYSLDLLQIPLGTISLFRRQRYNESELALLERAMVCLCKGLKFFHSLRILEQHSSGDPLTGLLNRNALDQNLDREIARAQRHGTKLSLMLLDADHFKEINDNLGHLIGDHVLRTLADLMQQQCRGADTVYRMGGDEFVIVLPETGLKDAIRAAERLCERLATQPPSAYFLDKAGEAERIVKQPPRLSIGVAELDTNKPTREALLNAADARMYQAKAKGRGRVN